jgi:hypothetical protein
MMQKFLKQVRMQKLWPVKVSASVYTCTVVEQGACAFKKGVFKKRCSIVAWKNI